MTTDDELRKLIALGEKATARPWNISGTRAIHDRPTKYTASGVRVGETANLVATTEQETDAAYITAAANLAPEIAAELIAAREEIQRLRVALESLRITSHTECEDCWYSCPKSDDYCGTDDREHCACGMDKQNAIIDAALNGGDV